MKPQKQETRQCSHCHKVVKVSVRKVRAVGGWEVGKTVLRYARHYYYGLPAFPNLRRRLCPQSDHAVRS